MSDLSLKIEYRKVSKNTAETTLIAESDEMPTLHYKVYDLKSPNLKGIAVGHTWNVEIKNTDQYYDMVGYHSSKRLLTPTYVFEPVNEDFYTKYNDGYDTAISTIRDYADENPRVTKGMYDEAKLFISKMNEDVPDSNNSVWLVNNLEKVEKPVDNISGINEMIKLVESFFKNH